YICYTIYFISINGFTDLNLSDYSSQLTEPSIVFTISLFLLLTSLFIIYKGLKNGIERISKFFVPFFAVVIIYLVIYTTTLDGATEKLFEFLNPQFSQITSETLFAALGQAFFSLGLGGTFLVIYGSYIADDEPLIKSAFLTALGDTGSALLASLFIIPAILLFSLDMSSGPTLIFSTLPKLFATMPYGRILGSFFLIALFMVAYLSNIAALEVIFGGIKDEAKIKLNRKQLIVLIGFLEICLISITSLKPELIGTLDLIFGSGMQVLGSCLAMIAVGWFIGRTAVYKQVFQDIQSNSIRELFFILIKYIIPIILLLVLIVYIYTSITGSNG
ncbi:MAG: hypothetical protein KDD94_09785, partial [Calditrichaeota bacterium]|nr:hypothetical protein [Calditrichota bacterium]